MLNYLNELRKLSEESGSRSEGIARSLVDLGIIPYYGDYTTVWSRIHDMRPDVNVSGMSYAEIGTDGTGMKTNNAGTYRITKYGDPDAKRRKHLVVIITADVKTKRIIGIDSHIEGDGISEPEAAMKHISGAVMKGMKIGKFEMFHASLDKIRN